MKRNKRTERVLPLDLNPLTERILANMGPEGAEIRRRLQYLYQQCSDLGATSGPDLPLKTCGRAEMDGQEVMVLRKLAEV